MPPSHATATTLKRIHREIADLKREDLGAIKLAPSDDDLFHWMAVIPGPEGSVYEGGVFHVEIVLGHDYPFSAPRMTFRTRIYHMNINERGSICIDILKHNWSPALSLFKVVLSLSSLLTDPNPKDPLVPSIATEYIRNRAQHDREARRWTELYARPQPTKDKGKGKASASPAPISPSSAASTGAVGRSTTASRTATPVEAETITIEDSDEDAPVTRSRATRARAAGPVAVVVAGSKRKRGTSAATGAVDIDLSTEDEVMQRPATKRRGGGNSSTSGAPRTDPGEVIVIED
ncbi:ubiquitin-conjugating enzyme/RWD-like protein [Dichomitus squalens]|uniref:E2 ubiquitin-conjugating enzyme n=1 Tax=Dichomitus squalens TaxID=114155 RepID=A0A4Q9MEV5_9APHY|nr:ubiquitin-conjugating enzyme/RWD-like protein [Dichomitus squalens]